MLNNWRSDIGKAGHSVIVDFWSDNAELFESPEDRAEYVAESLNHMRFVYKSPDVPVSINFPVTASW